MENKPYETRDADARWIALSGALLALVTVAIMVLLVALFWHLAKARPLAPEHAQPFPAPRLQVVAQQDLAAFRAREDAELHSYGWIDKDAGVVRIPIERAMELIAERGLPVRKQSKEEGTK